MAETPAPQQDGDAGDSSAELLERLGEDREAADHLKSFLAVEADPARRASAELSLSHLMADSLDDLQGAIEQLEHVFRARVLVEFGGQSQARAFPASELLELGSGECRSFRRPHSGVGRVLVLGVEGVGGEEHRDNDECRGAHRISR